MERLDLQPVEYARVLCTSQDLTIARVVPTRKVRVINNFVCLFFFLLKIGHVYLCFLTCTLKLCAKKHYQIKVVF